MSAHPTDPSRNGAAGWRIVLIGQSGLDRPLRREADVELVRVRNGLEAIGELARPIDASSPRRAAVLITPSAVDADDVPALSRRLREIDPQVRVLCIGNADGPWHRQVHDHGAIDGVVSADADGPGVRAALHAARPSAVTGTPIAPRTHAPTPADEPIRPPAMPESEPPVPKPTPTATDRGEHDKRILGSMLRGGPAGLVCLAILRERFGNEACVWHPKGADPAPRPGRRLVPVCYREVTFGLLDVSAGLDAKDIEETASWVGHWLALDEQQRQLRQAAFIDPLTGAWNRRFFEQHLDTVLAKAAAARQTVTVLLLDVHDLKRFNDQYGHAAGDAVLIETTRLLKSCVRTHDRVCRIGGDEFVVVFWEPTGPRSPGSQTPRSASDLARRFQDKLASAAFPILGSEAPGRLAVAGGMATYPWDGLDRASLLARADVLLGESKRAGKNAILFGAQDVSDALPEGF